MCEERRGPRRGGGRGRDSRPRRNLIWKGKVPNSGKKSTLRASTGRRTTGRREAGEGQGKKGRFFTRDQVPHPAPSPHSAPGTDSNSPSSPLLILTPRPKVGRSSYLIWPPRLIPLTNCKIDLTLSFIHSAVSRKAAVEPGSGRIWKSGT